MYIGLLATGFLLMWLEAICLCAKREMNALKINAFAAMCTVLSGEALQLGGGGALCGARRSDIINTESTLAPLLPVLSRLCPF